MMGNVNVLSVCLNETIKLHAHNLFYQCNLPHNLGIVCGMLYQSSYSWHALTNLLYSSVPPVHNNQIIVCYFLTEGDRQPHSLCCMLAVDKQVLTDRSENANSVHQWHNELYYIKAHIKITNLFLPSHLINGQKRRTLMYVMLGDRWRMLFWSR